MAYLTKEAILGAVDRKFTELEVPEWGGTVRLGEMTGAQRDAYEAEIRSTLDTAEEDQNVRARLVARCVVDEQGEPVFAVEDVAALGRKSAMALNRVFRAAVELNAMGRQDEEDAKKNSGAAASGEPPSGSASPSG